MNRYYDGYCSKHSKRNCERCRKEDERETDWGVFEYESANMYRRESALKIYRSKSVAQKAADRAEGNLVVRSVKRQLGENPKRPPRGWFRRCMRGVQKSGARSPNAVCGSVWYHKLSEADRRRITRESEYSANPKVSDNGLLLTVVGAGAAATLLWFLTRPAKASAAPDCPAGSDIIAYANSRGLAVTLFGGLPTSAPPAGYNAATAAAERIYNTQDCTFYKWQSFDGAKNTWVKDTKLTAEFNAWVSSKGK